MFARGVSVNARHFDAIVVGGGMAGVSAAYHLAARGDVLVLEQEDALAYHTTGRSAAMYLKSYGNLAIRSLTAAGETFFLDPPDGFSDTPLLTPRGALYFASADQSQRIEALYDDVRALAPTAVRLDADETRRLAPMLRAESSMSGIYEPDAMDMDVHAIHQGFVRGIRARAGQIQTRSLVTSLERSNGVWEVKAAGTTYSSPCVINAAGAWGDALATLAGTVPIGLVPKRRTAFLFQPPTGMDTSAWPLTIDVDERVYFKPDAGMLMCSPADETPSPPCDAQPEEIDIAIAVERLKAATTLEIPRITHRWAGLRTFTPDKTPVVGFDTCKSGFFWLVGQGGYGIQTAPALGALAAALVSGESIPASITALDVTAQTLSPARFESR